MSGSPTSGAASSTSSQRSTPSRRLWVEYAECGCTFEFKKRWFGFFHWYLYTKLRYWWRWFFIRLMYPNGKPSWYKSKDDSEDIEYGGRWPILMNEDEYQHWFGDEK